MQYKDSCSLSSNLFDSFSNENNETKEEIPQVTIDSFRSILEALHFSDDAESEEHTIKLLNDFRSFLRYEGNDLENPQKKESFKTKKEEIILANNPIRFLTSHASETYSIKIRENSLNAISDLVAVFPDSYLQITRHRYFRCLQNIFESFPEHHNTDLLSAAYKGLGNFLANPKQEIARIVLENIPLGLFFRTISLATVDPPLPLLLYINFVLHNFIKIRPEFNPQRDEMMIGKFDELNCENFMSIFAKTLTISLTENNLILKYALDSIYLYLSTFPESRIQDVKSTIIELNIYTLISRFFEYESLIVEQFFATKVLAQFYKIQIPDDNDHVVKLIPLMFQLSQLPDRNYLIQMCDVFKIIFCSERGVDILLKLYSHEFMQLLFSILERAELYQEKIALYGLLSCCLIRNSQSPPLHPLFFTEGSIIALMTAVDDDMNPYLSDVVAALYCMFDICQQNEQQFGTLVEYIQQYGLEIFDKLILSPIPEVSSNAILIQSMIETVSSQ